MPRRAPAIDKALAGLKEFNQYVVMTPGNAGTLDMLNRGEIAMGPVWVDMFYTWQADGRMSPKMKLALPSPGLPGQPMYYVIPAKAAHAQLAKKFIELRKAPKCRPTASSSNSTGIRASIRSTCSRSSTRRRGTSSSPTSRRSDLSKYGRPFPLSPYFKDIVEGYERVVLK